MRGSDGVLGAAVGGSARAPKEGEEEGGRGSLGAVVVGIHHLGESCNLFSHTSQSAYHPSITSPLDPLRLTRSPFSNSPTPSPTLSTTPATSFPSTLTAVGSTSGHFQSLGFEATATLRISTSPSAGTGMGRSTMRVRVG